MKKHIGAIYLLIQIGILLQCQSDKNIVDKQVQPNYSGTYCINIQSLEMIIIQTGTDVTFSLKSVLLADGTGTVAGDSMRLFAVTEDSANFTSDLVFSADGQEFIGPFKVVDTNGETKISGILYGKKGVCSSYDVDSKGYPKFVKSDFTDLSKIHQISKFRSGFGHSYTDGTESCRSMKHYYTPFEKYRKDKTVEIYSPVDGTIVAALQDFEAGSDTLSNMEIQIEPDAQPAFIITLFHVDVLSPAINVGKKVKAGEMLGHAKMYYEQWKEFVTSFDIAVWVNTPTGSRLVPFFEIQDDVLFKNYIARGALSRQNFIISKQVRDANPLQCLSDEFVDGGNLENWVTLK
ncbi:hypothetical protein JXQ31_01330 [candidate division KSB1 bacterium]|nr:hypothetical protein [candidate division KSB1 bacterium]